MGFKCFASGAGQKHSEPYVFSFTSCNYQGLKEGFIVLRYITEKADTVCCFAH